MKKKVAAILVCDDDKEIVEAISIYLEQEGHQILKAYDGQQALSILEKVRMIKFAESLGGVETLVTYPTTQTHADVPKEIREKNGITEATLRMSVGIEDAKDLIDELEKVFRETEQELYGGKKS